MTSLYDNNVFGVYECVLSTKQYKFDELINLLRQEIQSELDYVNEYNLTDDEVLDSTSFDIFDSVFHLFREIPHDPNKTDVYKDVLTLKLHQLLDPSYEFIEGDCEVFYIRYGILYDLTTNRCYIPLKMLLRLSLDEYNSLYRKCIKPFLIFYSCNEIKTLFEITNIKISDDDCEKLNDIGQGSILFVRNINELEKKAIL